MRLCVLQLLAAATLLLPLRAAQQSDCPVCWRIVRTIQQSARQLSAGRGRDMRSGLLAAFLKYCALSSLDDSERKFCYNSESMREELLRMMTLTDDPQRVCAKFRRQNSDFCETDKTRLPHAGGAHVKRIAVIYS